MTTDPIGELIEAAKEMEYRMPTKRLTAAIAGVEQMRQEKRPTWAEDNLRGYIALLEQRCGMKEETK